MSLRFWRGKCGKCWTGRRPGPSSLTFWGVKAKENCPCFQRIFKFRGMTADKVNRFMGFPRPGRIMTDFIRTLIHIPIVHTPVDMGGLAEPIRKIKIEKLGRQGWMSNVASIEQMWKEIRRRVEQWDLPYPRVRVYQDGLPVCGHEVEIVSDLARAGSLNHQLVLHLLEKGAELTGTESAEILLEEYGLVKRYLASKTDEEARAIAEDQRRFSNDLLVRRDAFIAKRINETLRAGETGILFLGMLHDLGDRLDPDIRVSHFDHPSLRAGKSGDPTGSGEP